MKAKPKTDEKSIRYYNILESCDGNWLVKQLGHGKIHYQCIECLRLITENKLTEHTPECSWNKEGVTLDKFVSWLHNSKKDFAALYKQSRIESPDKAPIKRKLEDWLQLFFESLDTESNRRQK